MWEGYFNFGGMEIVSNERARAYSRNGSVPVGWLVDTPHPSLITALQALDSTIAGFNPTDPTQRPWYDASQVQNVMDFMGVFALSATGVLDSSRTVPIIENTYDGGSLGIPRKATKVIKITAIMLAANREALEFGFSWLDNSLDAQACGQHGRSCGLTDLTFFADVPPGPEGVVTDDSMAESGPESGSGVSGSGSGSGGTAVDPYAALVSDKIRYLHDVGTVSGPLIDQELQSCNAHAYIVDFTIQAVRPWVFKQTIDQNLGAIYPQVWEDNPRNLVPYPSMELSSGTVTAATNYATNPSSETTAMTGGYTNISGSSPTSAMYTVATSTDVHRSGTHSTRLRVAGDGSTNQTGHIRARINETVAIAYSAGTRVSCSMWGVFVISAGASVSTFYAMAGYVVWQDSSGNNLRTDQLGSNVTNAATAATGVVFSQASIQPPAGTAQAVMQITYEFSYTSSSTAANNSDIRCYADTVIVSVP